MSSESVTPLFRFKIDEVIFMYATIAIAVYFVARAWTRVVEINADRDTSIAIQERLKHEATMHDGPSSSSDDPDSPPPRRRSSRRA
jgi:hypothetical protein